MFQVRRFVGLFHGDDGLFDRIDADVGVEEAGGGHAFLHAVADQSEIVFPETVQVQEDDRLGVQIQPVDAEIAESLGLQADRGALVVEPMQGSPAAKAGIETGDVIVALNDEPIEDASDLSVKIASAGPSSKVQLSVWRDGETKSIDLTLGNLAKADVNTAESQDTIAPSTFQALPSVGLTVAPAQEGNGLVIAKVDPESDAASQGIFEGERIASINNRKVSDIDDAKAILNDVQKSNREHALFQIEGERGSRFVALPVQQS